MTTYVVNFKGPNPVQAPPHVIKLLDKLHAESKIQEQNIVRGDKDFDDLMRDKFIALDQDKSQFLYTLARATNAHNIVEVGTSFGVSTIYLALAVGSNVAADGSGGKGVVIGTEKEPTKAAKAREFWKEAGDDLVTRWIDLREGDLQETLKENVPTVDLVLLDIWTPLALPALKLLEPRLRKGAIILTDNTITSRQGYEALLNHLRDPANGYLNLTVPYTNGFELSVKV